MKKMIADLTQALTDAKADIKETKVVKGTWGRDKEVPKTPDELQRDKEIVAAKLVLQREASVAKRETDCDAREKDMSKRISDAVANERKQAEERQKNAVAQARAEERKKEELEKKRLKEERDQAVAAQETMKQQLLGIHDRYDDLEEVADGYAYLVEKLDVPEDWQPLNNECQKRLQALKQPDEVRGRNASKAERT